MNQGQPRACQGNHQDQGGTERLRYIGPHGSLCLRHLAASRNRKERPREAARSILSANPVAKDLRIPVPTPDMQWREQEFSDCSHKNYLFPFVNKNP
jgi:hypothetical protein